MRRAASRWDGFLRMSPILALIVVLGMMTYERNKVFADEIVFWESAVEGSPQKARPHMNLGSAYVNVRRFPEAEAQYKIALQLNPNLWVVMSNLGAVYADTGRYDEADYYLGEALKIGPAFAETYINLGVVKMRRGQLSEARELFMQAKLLATADKSKEIIEMNLQMLDKVRR